MAGVGSPTRIAPKLDVAQDVQVSMLRARVEGQTGIPRLRMNTVQHRERIPTAEKIKFRVELLRTLREAWGDDDTETMFLDTIQRVEAEGCALFGGLIDPKIFARLIEEYDKVQAKSGNNAFMHSYANLATEHDFILGGDYIQAFSHPLLVALISYLLGGSIRIVDLRGKNNDPISINAQDNMLHVDNTPFKEEYKVLLNWRRGQVKGPSGQNFTFLPWTHRGNRDVLINEQGLPWSTERESLFVSDEAIKGLFDFQQEITGASRVVEATHPEQPLAILFPAGALVHHRYRTELGDPRSCIITAFHLSAKHPGQISELPPVTGRKKTLIEFLVGYQDKTSNAEFLELIAAESERIQEKLQELAKPSHPSRLLDLAPLALKGEQLERWHQAVVGAPSPIDHRFKRNLRLADADFGDCAALTKTLAAVMDYDKHCNLQMVLYEDGREEIRKPGRKVIGEMKVHDIEERLKGWTSHLGASSFSASDLVEPRTLAALCDVVSALAKHLSHDLGRDSAGRVVGQSKMLLSLSRLMTDLGEAIVRCDGIEAFVVTSLFVFLTSEQIYSQLRESDRAIIHSMLLVMLRNYVATTLLVEGARST